MTQRPIYSEMGMIRAMQMSSKPITLWVEGKSNDPYFIDSILRTCNNPVGVSWTIRRSAELTRNAGGGKKQLLAFYRTLSRRKILNSTFGNKKTSVIFFLDKDTDDITRRLINCNHVVYTKSYNIENEIFTHSNAEKSISCAASLEPERIQEVFMDFSTWRKNLHRAHLSWLHICLLALKCDIGKYGLRKMPPDNFRNGQNLDPKEDPELTRTILEDIRQLSRISSLGFTRRKRIVDQYIKELLANDRIDEVFNGKWYKYWICRELCTKLQQSHYDGIHLTPKLEAAFLSFLDFGGNWADHYRLKLEIFTNASNEGGI